MMRKLKLPMGIALCGLVAAALVFGRATLQAQGAPVLNPAVVLGPNVTFTWSTVPGASSYVLQAGIVSGQYALTQDIGNTATYSVQAPGIGVYFVRVVALVNGVPLPSNEIAVQVLSMTTAPTGLTTYLNGFAGVLTWTPSAGNLSHYVLQAGTAPGATDVGSFLVAPTATSLGVPFVPPGTYYLRVVPFSGAAAGPASNEAILAMPAGGGCSAPPASVITPTIFGTYVRLSWPIVPGAAGYQLNFTGTHAGSQTFPGNQGSVTIPRAPLGIYELTLTTAFTCGGGVTLGPPTTITVDGAPPPGPRTSNPAPGTRLALPNRLNVVQRVAARLPFDFVHSCPTEHRGDSNRFLFELVKELRREDNRWGLNWKRGNRGDMSQDIVTYNYGSESDEDTTQVYIVDIMFGHCGNPSPGWIDQTENTRAAGTIGRWTLLPYLDRGYPVVSPQ